MSDRVLADALVAFHAGFILFVCLGGLLVLRWPRLLWLHLPCAAWGVLVELMGWVCFLTPLENELRRQAGLAGYEGGFIENYVIPVVYPERLTRAIQIGAGLLALGLNAIAYSVLLSRRRRPNP